ncbi:hypothetical protein [Streptomyces sp. NPDC008001]|uniref:hypothetical protein n=1 Tax=Streptomyces sp. NPDC008001 TaxID=3364804 RepID=UPI0036F18A44
MRVLDAKAGEVEFRSAAGSACGVWRGGSPPQSGVFDVEFDIPDTIDSWQPSRALVGGIRSAGASDRLRVSVSGTAERVEAGSVVSLRVCSDIVLVELGDATGKPDAGAAITFTARRVELWPYQL